MNQDKPCGLLEMLVWLSLVVEPITTALMIPAWAFGSLLVGWLGGCVAGIVYLFAFPIIFIVWSAAIVQHVAARRGWIPKAWNDTSDMPSSYQWPSNNHLPPHNFDAI